MVSTTISVAESIRTRTCARDAATQMSPPDEVIAVGPPEMPIVAFLWPVGSRRVTLFASLLVTQTSPSAATAIPDGAAPTGNSVAVPVWESILDTLPPRALATQIGASAPGPTAIATGSCPTSIVSACPVCASILSTWSVFGSATQSEPSPTAIARTPEGTSATGSSLFAPASNRYTLLWGFPDACVVTSPEVIQAAPLPAARPVAGPNVVAG